MIWGHKFGGLVWTCIFGSMASIDSRLLSSLKWETLYFSWPYSSALANTDVINNEYLIRIYEETNIVSILIALLVKIVSYKSIRVHCRYNDECWLFIIKGWRDQEKWTMSFRKVMIRSVMKITLVLNRIIANILMMKKIRR